MREQLLQAFAKANVAAPEDSEVNPASPALLKEAEEFYNNTEIKTSSKMERSLDLNLDRRMQDLVFEKIAPMLGIDDADIVRARMGEQVRLLSELRGHDALADMLLKIGLCAGVVDDNEASQPHSTIRALAIGKSLQNIFSKMNQTVMRVLEDTSNERGKVATLNQTITRLQTELAQQRSINLERTGPATNARSAINGTEAPYFIIIGDLKADAKATDTTPLNKIGYLTVADPDDNKITKYVLRPTIEPLAIRKFVDIEKARELIEKFLKNDGKHRFHRDQVCSFRIGRQAIEHWGS